MGQVYKIERKQRRTLFSNQQLSDSLSAHPWIQDEVVFALIVKTFSNQMIFTQNLSLIVRIFVARHIVF